MDEVTRAERARTFGVNPTDYDAVRPGYPAALFEQIWSYAGLNPGAQVLEIGCGTGQATQSLVDLDVALTCIEPSHALCELAQAKFSERSDVAVLEIDFESFESSISFDLVLAATSFHWLAPEMRYLKTINLLREGGTLAIASNTHPRPYTGFFEAVQACYDRHVPEWSSRRRQPDFSWDRGSADSYEKELRSQPGFTDIEVHAFNWHVDFSAEAYYRLLHTFSDHIRLGQERLAALASEIRELINDEYDGVVHRPYRSILRLARTVTGTR